MNQILARRILESAGHLVVVVSDGRQTIDAWNNDGWIAKICPVSAPSKHKHLKPSDSQSKAPELRKISGYQK